MSSGDEPIGARLERVEIPSDAVAAARLSALVKAQLLDEPVAEVRVDRFIVLDTLGAGGMGVVYAAYDPQLDRKVAIKLLRRWGLAERDADRERLLREARALAKLSHPNVVPVYEVGEHDGGVFLAMEFVRGATLRERVTPQTPWRETVAIYLQAGEGLAAAHASGLVHRDFKPDNALVGEDGRVRVVDFGLARGHEPGAPDVAIAAAASASIAPLDERLTAVGATVGTPGYMAPEQRRGSPVDARGDQYSFCAALLEALGGGLPRVDGDGERIAVPSHVPTRVRQALARGLATAPGDRFASMRALLDALYRARSGARRVRIAAALALALGVGAGAMLSRSWTAADPCPDATPELAGVWDPTRAQALFAAADLLGPVARAAAEGTAAELDRHTAAWIAERHASCEALYVRRTDSQLRFDRRMRCLDRQRAAVDSLVTALVDAPAPAWAHAVEAAVELAPAVECDGGDVDAAVPTSPEQLATIDALHVRIDRVENLGRLGRLREAHALAEQIVADALAIGHRPSEAEALRLRAGLLGSEHRDAEVLAVLADAAWRAEAGRADELALDILAKCLTVAADLGELEQADAFAPRVQGALERLARPTSVELQVLRARSTLALAHGRLDEAEALARAGVELGTRLHGADSLWVGQDLNNLGLMQYEQGKFAEARVSFDAALRIKRAWLGPEHPDVIMARTNLAGVDEREGHVARARAELESVIADAERSLAPSPLLAAALGNLANLEATQGHGAAAVAWAERGVDVLDRTVEPDDLRYLPALLVLGLAYDAVGRSQDERAAYERAYAIADRRDPDHPQKAYLLNNLAELDLAVGDVAAAREKLVRAVELWTRTHGADHPVTGQLEHTLARVELTAGAHAEAATLARESIAILSRGAAADDERSLADARWLLAQASAGLHGRPDAEGLDAARVAAADFARLGDAASAAEAQAFVEKFAAP